MARYLLCGLAAASLLTPPLAARQEPAFRSESDLVRIYATVQDKDGRLVTDLRREDFEIRDKGKPQPIALFDNTPRPIRLVVMIDVSGSMVGNFWLLREAATRIVATLGPDDRARIGTFGKTVAISEAFTRDAHELESALPNTIDPNAPTPLWRGIDEAISVLDEVTDERRVVIVLSDGKDSGPASLFKNYVSQVDVMDRSRDEDVMIYGIGIRSRMNRPIQPGLGTGGLQAMMMADEPDPGLARVAEDSGGGYRQIRPNQDLWTVFAEVAREIHSQYLIGFAPPARDGKVHDVEVRLKQRGLEPRARKGYRAP